MTRSDRIISELVEALDIIRREAEHDEPLRHFIIGVCEGATKRCNAERVRDDDGYLVVKESR